MLDYRTLGARGLYTNSSHLRPERARLDATFEKSAPDLDLCPDDDRAEVAFVGRSNAGKSSVLNAVTGNRRLARTSKTPGRTQAINCFAVAGGGRLVDLPGYGFARAAKQQVARWQRLLERYLTERENLAGVVLVMDIRRPLEPLDRALIDWAWRAGVPVHALLNKADKLGHARQKEALAGAQSALADPRFSMTVSMQLFSAATGLGRDALIARLNEWLRAQR